MTKKLRQFKQLTNKNIEKTIDSAFKISTLKLKSRDFWKGLPHKKVTPNQLDGTFDEKLEQDFRHRKQLDIAQNMINSAENNDKVNTITGVAKHSCIRRF